MNYSDFYNEIPKTSYKVYKFKNKHGERFYVIRVKDVFGSVFITGDEYSWEMTPLFNPGFSIYSDEELREIGKALQEAI